MKPHLTVLSRQKAKQRDRTEEGNLTLENSGVTKLNLGIQIK